MTFIGSFKTEHTMEDALRTEMRTSRAFFHFLHIFCYSRNIKNHFHHETFSDFT